MLFADERRVVTDVAVTAGLFLAGEAVGFAWPAYAVAWPWVAVAGGWLWGVLWGWSIPGMRFVAAVGVGIVLAWHTEDGLGDVRRQARHRSPHAGPPVWELPVLGMVTTRPAPQKGLVWARFPSRLGPLEVDVRLPVACGQPLPRPDETWTCAGWLSLSRDPALRYKSRTLWVMTPKDVLRSKEAPVWAWRAAARRWGMDFARRSSLGLRACPTLAVLNRAILLGDRANLPRELKESFVMAGTMHVFAISGLHVMLVAHILVALLKCTPLPVRWRGVAAIVPTVAYVALTGMRPSAVRAAMAAGFYLLAPVFGRRPDALAAWSLTVFCVYGLAPERMFDIGCTLSFTVMLGIVIWVKWARMYALPQWCMHIGGYRKTFGVEGLGVTVAAWAAGIPVAARLFGRFTWAGLAVNMLVICCAGGTVAFGAVGVALSYVDNRMAAAFNLLAAGCTQVMVTLSEWAARLPGATIEVAPWSGLECLAWYGGWILALMAAERLLVPRTRLQEGRWW